MKFLNLKTLIAVLSIMTLWACDKPDAPTEEPRLTVVADRIEADAAKCQKFLKIVANVEWTVSSQAEWITFSATSGNGDKDVICTFDTNAGAARTASITVSTAAEVDPVEVTVAQAAGQGVAPDPDKYLSVDQTGFAIEADGDVQSFNVTANVAWTVSTTAEWIELDPESGDGNEEVAFLADANTGAERTASIIVSSTENVKPVTVTIVQADGSTPTPDKYLRVSKTDFAVDAVRNQKFLTITSNVDWNITCGASWITVSAASGNADADVVCTFDANTGAERTSSITVSSTENVKPVTVTIVQAAGGDTPDPDPNKKTYRSTWAELPVEYDSDNNGIDDKLPSLYYAHHLCAGGEKNAQNGKARNYTVCYSSTYHCPVWVAAPRHSMYVGSANRTNAYGKDPEIPSGIQYSSKSTGGGCNKGHMLGSAERTSSTATNRQVFYYTNIAPQLSATFNTGGGAWNNLEDYIDGLVPADTLYEVVGCYFDSYTDAYGQTSSPTTISFGSRNDVSRPTMFYYALLRTKKGNTRKSVMDCSASELQCVAFVIRHTMEKGHKPQAKDMISISELEKLTGFTYFSNVPNAPKTTFTASDWGI